MQFFKLVVNEYGVNIKDGIPFPSIRQNFVMKLFC